MRQGLHASRRCEMRELIAILDDEPDLRELISLNLKKNGYRSKEFEDAKSFYAAIKSEKPDLLLLDLMLPDIDGMEVCKYLKKNDRFASIPIIMLTAKQSEVDKVLGLELGADDYITKPFSVAELVARVKAVLRRRGQAAQGTFVNVDDLILMDLQKHEVTVNRKAVQLTLTEFKILELLCSQRGQVFSREQLLDNIWGEDKVVTDRTVDVHIKNLRDKLGPVAGKRIRNIRGIGYKLK
jgi:DNA-binding response OmpR family regulator